MNSPSLSQTIRWTMRFALLTVVFLSALGYAPAAYGLEDPRGVIIKDIASSIDLNGAVVVPLDTQYVTPELYHYLDSCGADSIKVVVPGFNRADTLFMRPDGVQVRLHDLSLYYKVYFADSLNLDSFAIGFKLIDSVSTSFPDVQHEFSETGPTDPLFDEQVYLQPESPGNGGAINAVGAWDVTTGDSSQIIAFIDSGIDGDHPDIDEKIFGGSFVGSFSEFDLDISGHGTSVAGILAAETNNGFGIAGINWAAQLFVSRVTFDVSADQFDSDFAPQVQAATNSGAKQINMSLGGVNPFLTVAAETMENAWRKDISLVGSKGNGGNSGSHFPSDYYYVVGVGALRKSGQLRDDSNWGHDVRLVAQGEDIKTLADGGGFRDFLRTSSAAPQVTAAISLVRAANPSLTADEVENILYLTAIDNTVHGTGFDDHTGFGTPDVGAAVAYATSRFFVRLGGPHTSLVAMPIQPFVIFDPVFGFGPIAGTAQSVLSWAARRYIDYSEYTFIEIPDILIRARSFSGWPLENSIVSEVPAFRIVSQDLNGAMLETGIYWVNGSLWPCDNPPCASVANTNIQVTVAGIPGVVAPLSLGGEGFDALQHKQRVKLGWADQNNFEHGWIVERKITGAGAPWIVIATLPANSSSGVIYYARENDIPLSRSSLPAKQSPVRLFT